MADDIYADSEEPEAPDLSGAPREATADFWTKPRALKGSAGQVTGKKIAADSDDIRGAARVFRSQAGWLRDAETKMSEEVELAAGVFREAFWVEQATEFLRETCAQDLRLLADLCEDMDSSLIEVADLWDTSEGDRTRSNDAEDFTMTQPDVDLPGYEDPGGLFDGEEPTAEDLPPEQADYQPGDASTISGA